MENFKTPLTWVLGIVCVGYLFIANCECGEGSTCPLNTGLNISNADLNNGFNISNADLNNRFNISNTGLNGDVLKANAPETVEEDGEMVEGLQELLGLTDSEMEMLTNEADSTDELMIAIEETGGMEEE